MSIKRDETPDDAQNLGTQRPVIPGDGGDALDGCQETCNRDAPCHVASVRRNPQVAGMVGVHATA